MAALIQCVLKTKTKKSINAVLVSWNDDLYVQKPTLNEMVSCVDFMRSEVTSCTSSHCMSSKRLSKKLEVHRAGSISRKPTKMLRKGVGKCDLSTKALVVLVNLWVRIGRAQDLWLLNPARVVMIVSQCPDTLSAATSSIQTLLKRIHPWVDRQIAAKVAGGTRGAWSSRHLRTTDAHHTGRATPDARIVLVAVLLLLLLSSKIKEHDQGSQNQHASHHAHHDTNDSPSLETALLDFNALVVAG